MGQSGRDSGEGQHHSSNSSHATETAIGLIHEAGRATRDREERSAQIISEVEQKVRSLTERVSDYNSRAGDAEGELQAANTEIETLTNELRKARDEIAGIKDRLVARERDMAVINDLADAAEKRALERSNILAALIEEIRLQFPAALDTGATKRE